MKFNKLATQEKVEKTISSLKETNITAEFVQTGKLAAEKVFSILPEGAEVMDMTSRTLESIGLSKEIQESGKYNSVRKKLMSMDRKTQSMEMQKIGSAPEYSVGSVHAVTEDGKVIVASNTGSQMASYVYGSAHVIWVVGTQKIVKNLDSAFKRIYDYVLPLESKRVQEAYGMPHSFVSKLLIFNKETVPNRIHLIFVNELLGF